MIRSNLLKLFLLLMTITGCNPNSSEEDNNDQDHPEKGSYGYDLHFLKENNIEVMELTNADSSQRILLVPGWQARVMTSSSDGSKGKSYGWINYELISAGEIDPQFNPFGGEERFWLGPEGGPYSIYFRPGKEQIYKNWKVPDFLDTEAYGLKSQGRDRLTFASEATLLNAAGNELKVAVEREVRLLNGVSVETDLSMELPDGLDYVAYQSVNTITNVGENEWTEDHGFVSIWMLCMFNPGPEGIVFIPVDAETKTRYEELTDDYFGKVPEDRLKLINGVVYFKVDGSLRSKIGISPKAAGSMAASYDAGNEVLTIVTYEGPRVDQPYVNSVWGKQENPLVGDAINAYNDGPVDGKIMGPFYEIETSSPAALLSPGQSLSHIQSVYHFHSNMETLNTITMNLFDLQIEAITGVFENDKSGSK